MEWLRTTLYLTSVGTSLQIEINNKGKERRRDNRKEDTGSRLKGDSSTIKKRSQEEKKKDCHPRKGFRFISLKQRRRESERGGSQGSFISTSPMDGEPVACLPNQVGFRFNSGSILESPLN